MSPNTAEDQTTFTYGEGSTPGAGVIVEFTETFVKRVDEDYLLEAIAPIERVVYLELGENRLYRYNGTTLVEVSKSLELGNTSTKAYRGDLGADSRDKIFDILNNKLPAADNLEALTYAELKGKRDNGELIPGKFYRITDYECTTTTPNTSSAGHQFDIIVVADNANTLNENANACLHEGDTYFANNKLEAWKLWYCLDNDTNRFGWADDTDGKGVIYRMIDELNNDVPYDFKNILFAKNNISYYTFTIGAIDASLAGKANKVYSNIINKYRYRNVQ